jgi:integrase
MSKPKFPKVIKRGHTTVKIYLTPVKGYPQYTVVHYFGGQRQRRMFSNLELALTEAETIATKLSAGELDVLQLRNEDRLAYTRAVEALRPTGVPLEMAALQFAEVWPKLGGVSLLEAVNSYLQQHPQGLPKKTVAEVVEELLAAKRADGASEVYLSDLRWRLHRFRDRVGGLLASASAPAIADYLRAVAADGCSRNGHRKRIGTLLHFAEQRGYLPRGDRRIEAVPTAKVAATEIEIFRPQEMSQLLAAARTELVPFLAIGAFAGLRHAEIRRLDWHEVRLEEGFIEVKAQKAKTASRRLVPVAENLKAWLLPYWRVNGPVCAMGYLSGPLADLGQAAGVPWKHNALRHSYISYRVAEVQNVAQVALEAGNSPKLIFQHYRELVRPAEAKAWFAITPGQRENLVALGRTALAPAAEAAAGLGHALHRSAAAL